MKKFFQEPLIHFLVAGVVLFATYGLLNRGANRDNASRVVHITGAQVNWLEETLSIRNHEIIARYAVAFLDQYLKGITSPLLDVGAHNPAHVTLRVIPSLQE